MEKRSNSVEELKLIAAETIAALVPTDTATIIALSGELGAGKTSFTQAVAAALGVAETVTSPTFVLRKSYELKGSPPAGRWKRLIHIDAYRLKGEDELLAIGWERDAADRGNLILIEWPERVPALVPKSATRIRFDIAGDGRIIHIYDGQESGKKD